MTKTREFTGKHMAIIMVSSFGVIIAVNLFMAYNAISTFPGVEVKNTYVASQHFNDRRDAQTQLGWSADASVTDGQLRLHLTDAAGQPVRPETLSVIVGHATNLNNDQTPDLQFDGQAFVGAVDVTSGNWVLRLSATAADGTTFTQRLSLPIKG